MEFFISTLLFGISVGGQYALIAIGYTMVYGILRLINFAHGDVFMVAGLMGIYLTSGLTPYLPPAAVIPASLAAARMAGRIFPSRPGGVAMMISPTPAMWAGMAFISTVEG